jgi:hypothetical protein
MHRKHHVVYERRHGHHLEHLVDGSPHVRAVPAAAHTLLAETVVSVHLMRQIISGNQWQSVAETVVSVHLRVLVVASQQRDPRWVADLEGQKQRHNLE